MTDELQVTPKKNGYNNGDDRIHMAASGISNPYDNGSLNLNVHSSESDYINDENTKHLEANSFFDVHHMAQSSPVNNNQALDSASKRFGMSVMHQNYKSTPVKTPINPFEQYDLIETMQMSSCSPSVFSKVISPSKMESESSDFQWGVENVALLYPKDFEVHHHHQPTIIDEETEEKVQNAINKYFAKMNVPSPWISNSIRNASRKESMNVNEDSCDGYPVNTKKDVWAQTTLSIPVDVDLNGILAKYFTFNENQGEQSDNSLKDCLSVSNLRRKLFVNDDDDEDSIKVDKIVESVEDKNSSLDNFSLASPGKFRDDSFLHYHRATSLSHSKHIQSPVESPIKPFHDEGGSETKAAEGSSASMNCSSFMSSASYLEAKLVAITEKIEDNERDNSEWESNMEEHMISAPSIQDADTGYQTGPGIGTDTMPSNPCLSLLTCSTDAQLPTNTFTSVPQLNLIKSTGDSSWSPSVFSTPSKHNSF